MTEPTVTVPTWTPPAWMNACMSFVLKTPLLHRMVSGSIVLITFTGRKSGQRHSTPVSYDLEGNTVTILTKKFRQWWKNFETHPDVELRLKGRTVRGRASASVGNEALLPVLAAFLERHPRDAQAYGITLGPGNQPDPAAVRALLPQIVIVRVALDS
jgi:deazaflavin-dependent oxidoreductase (nitroreductase family)